VIIALKQGGTFSAPHWLPTAIIVAGLALLLFLIAMVFWRGKS
jgi:hypothetical protein